MFVFYTTHLDKSTLGGLQSKKAIKLKSFIKRLKQAGNQRKKLSSGRREGLPEEPGLQFTPSEGARQISEGRMFQRQGATTEKAQFLVFCFRASLNLLMVAVDFETGRSVGY